MINENTENNVITFVENEYFSKFGCQELGKIDFCVTKRKIKDELPFDDEDDKDDKDKFSYFWAEAKKKPCEPTSSLAQLILTIGCDKLYGKYLPPKFLGCFDKEKITFIPYDDIQKLFSQNDFNWNVTPSNHETKEFKQMESLIKESGKMNHSFTYYFGSESDAIHKFIKDNFVKGGIIHRKEITTNNLFNIYLEWEKIVKPTILCDWDEFKKGGIIDADFYLADLLSEDNKSIKDKLNILLKTDHYKINYGFEMGRPLFMEIQFNDDQKAHAAFWNKYERPPLQKYWDTIINRRDILVPQDIRERKGSFFTPQKWVNLSQQYLASALGENWQDKYTIWDCAAGTGNLLTGLANKANIYASTIDKQDVDVMRERVNNGANLLDKHIFQFDFLNDDFFCDKVPVQLQAILKNPDERKKLVIYINPPYAEATNARTVSGTGENKTGVSNTTKVHDEFIKTYGTAMNELFVQFLVRAYSELDGCTIANFSKIKNLQAPNFGKFRELFLAKLRSIFLIPADTFDNVKGHFPIGFFIWDTKQKEQFKKITADVFDRNGDALPKKNLCAFDKDMKSLNQWAVSFKNKNKDAEPIGLTVSSPPDFQHQNQLAILSKKQARYCFDITRENLIVMCVYFAVRHVIKNTWLNDRDQFLYPKDDWKGDKDFQNNCLVYTLFHGQNRISSKDGDNNWIPFSENDVGAQDSFASHFMQKFIAGKLENKFITSENKSITWEDKNLKQESIGAKNGEFPVDFGGDASNFIPTSPIKFSDEAAKVLDAAKLLWRYFHKESYKDGMNMNYNVNASLYDIKEYFQGRDENGRLNNKSSDEKYARLLGELKTALDELGKVIEPKVYEYGFLI